MQEGDIVNIKYGCGYWKGRVSSISEGYNEKIKYTEPVVIVQEIQGIGFATVYESDLIFKNDEWWEK